MKTSFVIIFLICSFSIVNSRYRFRSISRPLSRQNSNLNSSLTSSTPSSTEINSSTSSTIELTEENTEKITESAKKRRPTSIGTTSTIDNINTKDTVNTTQKPINPNKPCPDRCICSEGLINCVNAGKTEIPSNNELPSNTKVIDLTNNQIKRLSALDKIPKLTKLILKNNLIQEFEPEALTNVPNLEELDLSFNENITRLAPNVLQPVEQLRKLKLTKCGLEELDEFFFKFVPHLTHLSIDSNAFRNLKKNFFKYLENLEYLDATNTLLTSIEIGIEYPLNKLKILNLSENYLDYVPLLINAPKIEKLNLDRNRIGVLNKDSFNGLLNLETLELSFNDELMDVEELTFAEQQKLKKLVLSHNPHLFLISKHAFYGAFDKKNFVLEELNLQKNGLHFLSEDMLTNHWGNLTVLDLRMNSWNCDCHFSWLLKYGDNRNVSEIRCKFPETLSRKRLVELNANEMICPRIIDGLLFDKLKYLIQGFVLVLAFLVFVIAFLLVYVVRDRPYGFMRLFVSPSSSTIYYQKANTKEQILY